jgi:hypothetical protein
MALEAEGACRRRNFTEAMGGVGGEEGERRSHRCLHHPHRPPYIAIDAGWMAAPPLCLQARGLMRDLFGLKKVPRPTNPPWWRDTGQDSVSARVALRRIRDG